MRPTPPRAGPRAWPRAAFRHSRPSRPCLGPFWAFGASDLARIWRGLARLPLLGLGRSACWCCEYCGRHGCGVCRVPCSAVRLLAAQRHRQSGAVGSCGSRTGVVPAPVPVPVPAPVPAPVPVPAPAVSNTVTARAEPARRARNPGGRRGNGQRNGTRLAGSRGARSPPHLCPRPGSGAAPAVPATVVRAPVGSSRGRRGAVATAAGGRRNGTGPEGWSMDADPTPDRDGKRKECCNMQTSAFDLYIHIYFVDLHS